MKRLELILSRLLWLVPTLIGLGVITFAISHVIPTDPVAILAGENATAEQIAALRTQLGFDRPLPVQLLAYFQDLLRGDMGVSLFSQQPIAEELATRLPATLELTFAAVLLASVLGIPLGVVSALRRNSAIDHALRIVTVSGLAIPSFWLAIQLQYLFAMQIGVAPLNGRIDGFGPEPVTGLMLLDSLLQWDWESFWGALRHIALPAITLALPAAATIARFTRAGVLEVVTSNYVLYERAMGLPGALVTWKYVLRNALISTVTQIGLIFGVLLSGAVVVEAVFDWPGLGAFAVISIIQSDHRAVMGFTLWAGAIFVIVNLIVDVLHTLIDPRSTR
ncbi:ABC transporter permease [Teichococcus aestuarii]|uniref:D-Ala-D-Ala transporter n=1 Tax=Teichococcus aestuarii TaxID=568898 RepID=A0A2U1V9T4_9PROT|nr:ABC transporter permease [Pseudoroseomonas aestuarii]PWC30677.1 D-Ala-D-Ala transporter [Pseudoroseomonas aestuarii]